MKKLLGFILVALLTMIFTGCSGSDKDQNYVDPGQIYRELSGANDLQAGGTIDNTIYYVIVNEEDQYTYWPVDQALPLGWVKVDPFAGNKQMCTDYVDEIWNDFNPLHHKMVYTLKCQVLHSATKTPRYIMWQPNVTSGFPPGYESTGFVGLAAECVSYVWQH
jgi:MbtH protein